MKIGLAALALAFIASGVMNIVRPQRSYTEERDGAEKAPSPAQLARTRGMGVLWCFLGVLCAALFIKMLLNGGVS